MNIPDLPWRPLADFPKDGSIVAVWCREWKRPDGKPVVQIAQWLDPYGTGGKISGPWNYDSSPFADGWLTVDELNRLQGVVRA